MSLEATRHYIKKAAQILDFSERMQKMLVSPFRSVKTDIVIELDNGQIGNFVGYRIQHNNSLGPMKGGLRYHPEVEEEEVESLASLMTWKNALAKLPFGGAKGGICCNPQDLSPAELERLTKSFTQKIKEIIGPYSDIPAPDVNTNGQTMAWIMSEYSKYYGFTPAVVTGKPVYLHGSEGREEATGLGVVIIAEALLHKFQKVVNYSSFAIQGFGNVGYFAAKFLYERGGKIVAISDVSGGIYNPQGIDIPALKEYVNANKTVQGFPGGEPINNEDVLTCKCDVLIPAALGGVFNADIAGRVNCKFIVEGANGPTLPEADEIFEKKGVLVAPDILANSGGVIVSYFEWVQNIQQFRWEKEKVIEQLNRFILDSFQRVVNVAEGKKCNYRIAAFTLGLGRVAKAKLTLGL